MDRKLAGEIKTVRCKVFTSGCSESLATHAPVASLLIGLLLSWLCLGCVPLKFTTSPGAAGRVIDARTHTPVSGAEVLVSRSTYPPPSPDAAFTNSRPPIVMSITNGQFNVPVERRLDLYFLPVDVFPRFGLLVVRHPGYQTACLPFWSHSMAELGDVQLQPIEK